MSKTETADLVALLDGMEKAFQSTEILEESAETSVPLVPPPRALELEDEADASPVDDSTSDDSALDEPLATSTTDRTSGTRPAVPKPPERDPSMRAGRALSEGRPDYKDAPPPNQVPNATREPTSVVMSTFPWLPEST